MLSVCQFGIRVKSTGIYHTSGTKTESAALIKSSLMTFNSFRVKKKKKPFPLPSSNCRLSERRWGRHVLKEKADMESCTQQLLAVFSMKGNLPGREGNPHLLDFTDMEQLVCQQSFISLIEL